MQWLIIVSAVVLPTTRLIHHGVKTQRPLQAVLQSQAVLQV